MDLVPPDAMGGLGRAKVLVTNFHGFRARETTRASKTTKEILGASFTETPDQMVRRVCRELGTKRNIVVLNDEAHHCYVRRSTVSADGDEEAVLKGDERKEAEQRNADARVWASGLEAVAAKLGARVVYDLSATPFFLRGSGYLEGKIFPWVVSDFSLIDAIEAGIVKVPRVPVSDDSMTGALPTYRELWTRIRDDLPRKGRKTDAVGGEPRPPAELEGALRSLYGNYERQFRIWEASEAHRAGATPPVFIVVCNNTNVSKLVFDFVAGWEKPLPGDAGTVVVPGALPLFSNERGGGWAGRPRTILVDSSQLEAEGAMSAEFKRLVATEIEEFKADYRTRFPGRDSEELTDEDLLREVMNTVGKAGKLGEAVRCVVSVSMLTEGWDANTVTHILGVRAFGTQLLCEQVVGRGLRRRSYTVNDEGRFDPEYAEVYGVPFSFIPSAGSSTEPPPPKTMTRVRALPERAETAEISFPRVAGYRYELARTIVEPNFGPEDRMTLSTADTPTRTKVSSILGEQQEHTLDDLAAKRPQEIAFHLTKRLLDAKFGDELGGEQPWMFPVLLRITRRWVDTAVDLKGDAFVGMLLLAQRATDAVERLYGAIVRNPRVGKSRLNPILRAYDPIGSTASVDFDTSKDTYTTSGRSHVSHVVLDSGWEAKMAQVLEDHRAVRAYVKNQGLGFTVPYVIDGEERQYLPDFLVRLDDGHGGDDLLKVIVEVSGAQRRDKEAKVNAARNLWVPAVNAHGGFGRWDYVEVTDPWDAEGVLDSLAYHAQVVA
jgi:type III restriction enzyme